MKYLTKFLLELVFIRFIVSADSLIVGRCSRHALHLLLLHPFELSLTIFYLIFIDLKVC